MDLPQPLLSMTPSSVNARSYMAASSTDSSSSPIRPLKLPFSPSLPEFSIQRKGHVRTNSDVHVQGLVKRFETLDVRDRDAEFKELRRKDEAALKRAEIAREEAEGDVMRLREENRHLKKELQDEREKQRLVATRLEAVKDEFQRDKEQSAVTAAQYDRELRKSRKESLKSSSTIIKLQEELKSARKSLQVVQQELELEKLKVQRRDHDTFNAQYQLVAVQQELEKLQMQMQVVQEEKVALKTNLKEEEVARIAAEGRIALPPQSEACDDLSSSPSKRGFEDDDKENIPTIASPSPQKRLRTIGQAQDLKDQLILERRWRTYAEELSEFLQLECRYRCCRCRVDHRRERQGSSVQIENIAATSMEEEAVGPLSMHDVKLEEANEDPSDKIPSTPLAQQSSAMAVRTVTMTTTVPMHFDTPVQRPVPNTTTAASAPRGGNHRDWEPTTCAGMNQEHELPMRPRSAGAHPFPGKVHGNDPHWHNIDTDSAVMDGAPSAGFDRAAALAAIEWRRGRAKSIAEGRTTPRKAMLQSVARRDITR